jgi:hypothetical protein
MMEILWADLSRRPTELPSPDWHREVLLERKRMVDKGKLQFLDWDTAITQSTSLSAIPTRLNVGRFAQRDVLDEDNVAGKGLR